MKVNETTGEKRHSLGWDATISRAADLFSSGSIQVIQVTDKRDRVMGIFTKEDLFRAVGSGAASNSPISGHMTREFDACRLDEEMAGIKGAPPEHGDIAENKKNPGQTPRLQVVGMFEHPSPELCRQINTFLDFIHNPVVGINARGIVIIWNQAAEVVFAHSRAEAIGVPITSLVSESQLQRVIQTGQLELVQKLKVNKKIYMSNRSPVKSGDKVVGAVALLQDISQLETISNELKETRMISAKLDAVIESSFDGIVVTDREGRITIVNKAYERITGVKRKEILGRKMDFLVNEGFYNESVTLLVLENREPTTIVQKIKTGKTVIVTGTPIFDEEGEVSLVVTNVRDVTELNRLQEKLEKMEILEVQYKTRLQKLRATLETSNGIIIASKKMEEVHELMVRTAGVDSTILLQGESGVGKEIFAELIHSNSKRRSGPFVKINCAAIPEHLLESELFGYVSGSFTGAKKGGKAGLFEAANQGSIFLDEIGDMPMGLQTKLLRVLQEKEILRVGDVSPRKIDVRIIAATNRRLEKLVECRKFRRDLFFRLNVVPIVIPPLRERKESISIFAYHFLRKYNLKYGFSKQLEPKVLNSLIAYKWPGNVRELENVLERLVVTTVGEVITPGALPENIKIHKGIGESVITGDKPLYEILDEVEYRVLTQTLKKYKTTRKMGEILGISQPTVVRKMRKHGMKTHWKTG